MRQIIRAFSTLMVLVLNMFLCITVINASVCTAAAKEYKADVIAEIENSNFNPNVISACKTQAQNAGYSLDITNCVYDEDNFISCAEVVLSYKYEMPLLGLSETKMTRGIAK